MKRRWKFLWIAIACGCGIVGFVLCQAWPKDKGPRLHGRSLYSWIQTYSEAETNDSPQALQAAAAVQELGTNAIPYLIQWLNHQEPTWADTLRVGLGDGIRPVSVNLSDRILWAPSFAHQPSRRAWVAFTGFHMLGPQAKAAAVPELARMVGSGPGQPCNNALLVLGAIGSDGLPTLLSVVTNKAIRVDLSLSSVWATWVRTPLRPFPRS